MKSPAAVKKLPGRYGFYAIPAADHSGRRHTQADAPAIVQAREISIRHMQVFFSVNMSAPPFFRFDGFCEKLEGILSPLTYYVNR